MSEETGYFGVCPLQGGEQRLKTCGEAYMERCHFRPTPCVRDQNGKIIKQSVKQLIMKVHEELIELEAAVHIQDLLDTTAESAADILDESMKDHIASESADLITAVTTLEEAIGITSIMRDKALETVFFSNKRKGRL